MTAILHREAVSAAIQEKRRRTRETWERYPSVQRFLQDWYPSEWERVKDCRRSFRLYRSLSRPEDHKITPRSCWRIPYCIPCAKAWGHHQTWEALERFGRVTPPGKPTRLMHIVITAPLTMDGWGWGWEASMDIRKFGAVVRKVLVGMYGEGVGGLMSYQDFGERGFAKTHPHYDLTLNGWRLEGDKAVRVARPDFVRGDHARLSAITRRRAMAFELDAWASNFDYHGPVVGAARYYRILRYQLRELVDLRKIEYEGRRETVGWRSYKEERVARMPVKEWLYRFHEYRSRFGLDGEEGTEEVRLHRYFGHMAKRVIRQTAALVGGEATPHGPECGCAECGDWETVYDDAYGQYAPKRTIAGP